jgi:hypothetical protein
MAARALTRGPRRSYELVEGWGMAVAAPARVLRPRSVEEIRECYAVARRDGVSLALRGTGNSYGDAFGVQRVNEAEIIHVLVDVRKELGAMVAGLAILLEFPEVLHEPLTGAACAGVGELAGIGEGHLLAILLFELGFVVEGIDLTDAALHEEEDDAFGLGNVMRLSRSERIDGAVRSGGRAGVLRGEPGQRHVTEAASEGLQGATAGEIHVACHHHIVPQFTYLKSIEANKA